MKKTRILKCIDPESDAEVQCGVERIAYFPGKKTGILWMPEDECCSMNGCIRLFIRISADVKCIRTFSGKSPDTFYTKRHSGEWQANRSPGQF